MQKQEVGHICQNYHHAVEFIGKKWVGAILYCLVDGPLRYSEIHARIAGISDRLLTQRLNELIESNMIEKTFIDESIKKTEYKLTNNGLAFREVILSIQKWVQICKSNDQ
ncbi:winged helix-turn-helix transcriptional regulator [Kurthia sibirica]|uniref:Transcriptional regulator n=1 Tax=Kurthia sibirica TaxID=202750 RepID=A0A2U3AIB2_9BACL|nr:helix-turn-helix domain-containing protein [Kurthia sibirica]PWI24247.1 transcriptional regulator [Kurthia sibirica]GEK34146.1 transcriptional regulator [Kurthia sibirica]